MQENKVILLEKDYQTKYAGFDPTSPESYIIFNNLQNNNLTQSLELAAAVQDQFRTRAQRKDIGVYQGNLVVLWGCAKPSILIETGFISNPQEEEFLMTDNGQDIIADAIYMAFRDYKESVDEKVGVLTKNAVADVESEKKTIEPEKKTIETVKKTVGPEKKTADTVSAMRSGSEVEYRVQILASLKKLPLNAKDLKGVKDLKEIKLDGYYKYLSKPVKTYQEALELRRQMGASFPGAFIVAFKNGERIPYNSVIDVKKN
jgi:N-acetylmuramoyl-L-alanine amidase